MNIELLIENGTKVYNYVPSSSGNTTIGSLKRIDNQQGFALDLYPDEKISLSYQIAEVRDPNKKTTSFSKSFYIPGTARNNLAMGYAYNPLVDEAWRVGTTTADTTNQEYNVTYRNAFLTVNGVLSFTGTLEILKAKTQNGNIVSYEVFFLASENTLLDLWDQVQLPELNFGGEFPAMTGSPTNFRAAMDNTDADATFSIAGTNYNGFTFGYPDWGFEDAPLISAATGSYPYVGYNPSELTTIWQDSSSAPSDERQCGLRFGYNVLPYQYLKSLVDKIFELAGYSYESTFFNSVDFRQMLLLYYDQTSIGSNMFMKMAATCPGDAVTRTGANDEYFPDFNGNNVLTNTLDGDYSYDAVPAAMTFESGKTEDIYGVYIGDGVFRFPTPGTWTIQLKAWPGALFGWDQTISPCSSGCVDPNYYPHATYPILGTDSYINFSNSSRGLLISESISGGSRNPITDQYRGTYTKNASTYCQWEYRADHFSTPLSFTITTIAPNEEWTLSMTTDASDYYNAPVAGPCPTFPTADRLYRPFCDFVIEDVSILYPNWSQTVPDISCKEFFNNLVSHFNLFVQINPNERKVIIDDRDNFFTNGEIQDWSSKIDLSQDREIQNFTPPKNVLMSFEESENWMDVDYRSQQSNIDGLPYGSLKVINNYGDGNLEIKSPFSPPTQYYAKFWRLSTAGGFQILEENGQNIKYTTTSGGDTVYPNIPVLSLYPKDENGRIPTEKSKLYIAYNNGFVDNPVRRGQFGNATAVYAPISTLTSSTTLSEPGGTRAAHVISQTSKFTGTPSSKAQVQLFSNTLSTATERGFVTTAYNASNQNTMYNKYWENYLDNQADTKIYRLKAYLTNRDISLFQFRNPIFLDLNGDGQYYIVNKIDIDPTQNGAATLELYTFNPLYFDFDVDLSIPEFPYEPIPPTE
jgi:hypothetical protein